MVSRTQAPWDKPTQAAIDKAVQVDKPVVINQTVANVTWRATLFGIAFALLNAAEEALKIIDLPAEWALLITTLAAAVIYALRQQFLYEMEKRG